MSNQLNTKAKTLAQMLAANKLVKSAQEISHPELVGGQKDLGEEQRQELKKDTDGQLASESAAKNTSHENVETPVGVQDLNKDPEAALNSSGTEVNTMCTCGAPTGTPAQVAKSASDYKAQLASILAMHKKASADQEIITGTEVMQKFASLTSNSTDQEIAEAQDLFVKLASHNPVFNTVKENIMMRKMAEDIQALAEAENVSPEEAAADLDAAAEANPEMTADLEDEAAGEAVADLANAEQETGDLMAGVDQLAANASEALGTEVTPDDIINATEQTVQMAEELGVEPEELIAAALEEMQGGESPAEGGMDIEISPEDEANAQAILDEAAQNGISPEEVIQMAAEELGGGEAPAEAAAEVPAEEPAAEGQPVEKAASLQKRASTMRAAFVQELRHSR